MPSKLKQQLAALPKKPGCYLFKDNEGVVLYVGKAKNLRSRVRSYFSRKPNFSPAKFSMLRRIADLETVVVNSELEALILESTLIKKYEPHFNVLLKDDKNFLFIKVTVQEDFPRVLTVRRISKDGARYFGPFTNSFAVRDTLRLLQRIFAYRTCDLDLQMGQIKARQYRPCLRYSLGLCGAPCIAATNRETYYKIIAQVLLFLEGKLDFVIKDLQREMQAQAQLQNFERAARLRDQIKQIEHLMTKQIVLSPKFTNQDVIGFVTDRRRTKAFAVIMLIRAGKVIGQEQIILSIDPESTTEEILRAIILQYYERAAFLPKELVIETKINDEKVLTSFLQQRAKTIGLAHTIKIRVPRRGLAKRLINLAEENAQEFRARKTLEWNSADLNTGAALGRLKQVLALKKIPERVEIYDISNIQGTSAVGSMAVFTNGKPDKAQYRRFKIKQTQEVPNDVGMLKEVLQRRLKRLATQEKSWPTPDLIIVDGGKPQLNSALAVLNQLDLDLPVISLAKREEEVFLPGALKSLRIPRSSSALFLLQRMRDEAHRFAITFHRQTRSKRSHKSILDEISGIGPKRKKLLIQKYGSVAAVTEASADELGKLIGKKAAQDLIQQLNN